MPPQRPSLVVALAAAALVCTALAGILLAEPARAQPRCGDGVRAWIAEAADATRVSIEPLQCPSARVLLRLHVEDAPPLDVEIGELPAPGFRPAGRFSTSPVVDVPDYGLLPASQRTAYEALVDWMTVNQERVVLGGASGAPRPRVVAVPTEWWIVGLALLLAVLGGARELRTLEWRPVAAVLAVALTARLALGVWGPFHVNGQGPLWVRGALLDPELLATYGPGYPELFGPIARAFTEPGRAVFLANALLSALAPVLLYGLARAADLGLGRALLVGMVLALDPISAWFGASESYYPLIGALVLGAAWLAVLGVTRARTQRAWPGAAFLLASALLAAQAARVHPIAWAAVALLPLAGSLGPSAGERDLRWRLVAPVGLAVLIAVAIGATSGSWIAQSVEQSLARGPGAAAVSGRGESFSFLALALALAGGALYVARPRAPIFFALAHVLVLLWTRHTFGQSQVWQAAFDRAFAPGVLLGLAALPPPALDPRWAIGLAALAALSIFAWERELLGPTTEQAEYAFLVEQLPHLPPECRIAHIERADRRIVHVPDWAHPGGQLAIRVRSPGDLAAAASYGCVYWLRTSLCTSEEGRSRCDAAEAGVVLDAPIATRRLHARPSYRGLPYDAPHVTVEVRRARPAL